MEDFITPIEKLREEAIDINIFLESSFSTAPDDNTHGDEIEMRGNEIAVYVSRTGVMLADAKYWLNKRIKSETFVELIKLMQENHLSATAQKEFIQSACLYETWLVNYIDRLNKSCTHTLDWYRSLLSKYKEELNASRGVSGQRH